MTKNKLQDILIDFSDEKEGVEIIDRNISDVWKKLSLIESSLEEYVEGMKEEQKEVLEKSLSEAKEYLSQYLQKVKSSAERKHAYLISLLDKIKEERGITNDSLLKSISLLEKEINNVHSLIQEQEQYRKRIDKVFSQFIIDSDDKNGELKKLIKRVYDEVLEDIKIKFSALSSRGGSMHRQLSINGTVMAVRYADINIIATGWSVSNNDTTKKTDITLPTIPTGAGYQRPLTGSLNQGTFTWTTAPNVIVVDGVPKQKTQIDGTSNWTGTTTTVLSVWPTFDIFSPN